MLPRWSSFGGHPTRMSVRLDLSSLTAEIGRRSVLSRWLGDVLYTLMVQPPLVSVYQKQVGLRPLVSIRLRLLWLRRVLFVP